MALLHFSRKMVDLAVVEVGPGGRLDSTNVIDPLLTVITNVTRDHEDVLGKGILKIAGEKAGIIKPGRPILTTAVQPKVVSALRQRSREVQAPFFVWKKDFAARAIGPQMINFRGRSRRWAGLRLGLAGDHQIANASLALAAMEILMDSGYSIPEEALREGLSEARWPGRLELIGGNPRVLLDGAHNPGATRVLRKALQTGFPRRRLILVMGVMSDKNISRMMADLIPLADVVFLTRPHMDRAASLDLLATVASRFRKPLIPIEDVGEAVEKAMDAAKDEDLVLVSGSLFTVGEARAYLHKNGKV